MRTRYIDSIGLFLLAVTIGMMAAIRFPFIMNVDGRYETLNVAKALADTGAFANPFNVGPTGPTAHLAPVFPAVAAGLKLLPFAWRGSLLVFGLVMCGLNAALLPCLSHLLFSSRTPGIIAGYFSAFSFALMPQFEFGLASFLCISALFSLISGARWRWLACGLAVLANPISILPLVVFGLTIARKHFASAAIGIAVLCAPWIARNWLTIGTPAPIRDNFGLELAVSNNECAGPSLFDNILNRCFQRSHPNYSAVELARLRSLGEPKYNAVRMQEAIRWIRVHPKRFLSLTARRFFLYLFPAVLQGPWAFGVWGITVIAALSVFVRNESVRILQISAVGMWLPYAIVQSDLRYRSGSLWCWFLLAGFMAYELRSFEFGALLRPFRGDMNDHYSPVGD